jgi:hypothetical protein
MMSASWIALAVSWVDTTFAASEVRRSNAAFAPIASNVTPIRLQVTVSKWRTL